MNWVQGAFQKKAVPSVRTSWDVNHGTFIHFSINKSKGLGPRRERFLGKFGAREENTVEVAAILQFGKRIFKSASRVKREVG